jgi:hypothetical protein
VQDRDLVGATSRAATADPPSTALFVTLTNGKIRDRDALMILESLSRNALTCTASTRQEILTICYFGLLIFNGFTSTHVACRTPPYNTSRRAGSLFRTGDFPPSVSQRHTLDHHFDDRSDCLRTASPTLPRFLASSLPRFLACSLARFLACSSPLSIVRQKSNR